MQDVYIVAANRTAFGKMGGVLREVRPDALACAVLQDILPRGGVAAEQVDEVILGQTRQSAEAANIARYAALLAGYPERVPAYTVMQQCSSAMQAIQNAANEIALGQAGVIAAGGVESMSMAPFYLKGGRYGLGVGNRIFADPVTEGSVNSQPVPIYGAFGTGDTAECGGAIRHLPGGSGRLRLPEPEPVSGGAGGGEVPGGDRGRPGPPEKGGARPF